MKRKRRHGITTKFIMIITYEGPQVLYNLVCDSLVKKKIANNRKEKLYCYCNFQSLIKRFHTTENKFQLQ